MNDPYQKLLALVADLQAAGQVTAHARTRIEDAVSDLVAEIHREVTQAIGQAKARVARADEQMNQQAREMAEGAAVLRRQTATIQQLQAQLAALTQAPSTN